MSASDTASAVGASQQQTQRAAREVEAVQDDMVGFTSTEGSAPTSIKGSAS